MDQVDLLLSVEIGIVIRAGGSIDDLKLVYMQVDVCRCALRQD